MEETELFSPYRFTLNSFIPSLGHLFLIGVMSAFFSSIFYRYFPFRERSDKGKTGEIIRLFVCFSVALIILMLLNSLFCSIVSESNINFEPYKVLDLSIYSIFGFASIPLIFLVPFVLTLKTHSVFNNSFRSVMIGFLTGTFVIMVIAWILKPDNIYAPLIFWLIINCLLWISFKKNTGKYSITVLVSLFFCLYSLYQITEMSEKKNLEKIKILAVSYSSENDPDAEHLLLNIWPVQDPLGFDH